MSVGAWDDHYADMSAPIAYGSSSYARIAETVADCETVADWGCGGGALRAFLRPEQTYVGIDGSKSPYATVRASLAHYAVKSDAVVLRHVLEHNDEWEPVLHNAVFAAQKRLVIVLFTPEVEQTRVMFREPEYHEVPVIAFNLLDLWLPIRESNKFTTSTWSVESPDTAFGVETFISCWVK